MIFRTNKKKGLMLCHHCKIKCEFQLKYLSYTEPASLRAPRGTFPRGGGAQPGGRAVCLVSQTGDVTTPPLSSPPHVPVIAGVLSRYH